MRYIEIVVTNFDIRYHQEYVFAGRRKPVEWHTSSENQVAILRRVTCDSILNNQGKSIQISWVRRKVDGGKSQRNCDIYSDCNIESEDDLCGYILYNSIIFFH